MAVQYVKDFSFAPSPPRPTVAGYARGGHVKPSTPKTYAKGGLAKGSGISNDAGHSGKNGPDRMVARAQGDGPVKYMAKGGLAKGKGQSNDAGHVSKGGADGKGAATKGQGDGDLKRSKVSAKVAKTKGEKTSGMQGKAFAEGGRVAAGKVPMGSKPSRNPDDATSPGSFKRTPVGQSANNKTAASSKFDAEGRNTPVATKQDGNVERMSGYSDFKSGGTVKHNRIKNLGHYAHGGKVKASGGEKASGVAKKSMGGLSRATSPKRNAAIHAKSAHKAPKAPSLGALASALSGAGVPSQGAGAPPGMAPGMGAPPGGQMGGMAPQAPTMGGGPPAMASGGLTHIMHHFGP